MSGAGAVHIRESFIRKTDGAELIVGVGEEFDKSVPQLGILRFEECVAELIKSCDGIVDNAVAVDFGKGFEREIFGSERLGHNRMHGRGGVHRDLIFEIVAGDSIGGVVPETVSEKLLPPVKRGVDIRPDHNLTAVFGVVGSALGEGQCEFVVSLSETENVVGFVGAGAEVGIEFAASGALVVTAVVAVGVVPRSVCVSHAVGYRRIKSGGFEGLNFYHRLNSFRFVEVCCTNKRLCRGSPDECHRLGLRRGIFRGGSWNREPQRVRDI